MSPVELYRRASRYPPTSRPLGLHQDDLIHPNKRHERRRPSRELPSTEILFTADRYAVTDREPLTPSLHAWRDQAPVSIELVESTMFVIAPAMSGRTPRPLPLQEQDSAWVATVVLADHFKAEEALQLRLLVAFRLEGADVERAWLDVLFTPPRAVPARFTGMAHDEITEGGALQVIVGVEVYRPGYFVIDANLWTASEEPVAFSRWKGTLGRGTPSVSLSFFGKAIRDRGLAGPYRLGELRGVRVAQGHDPDLEKMTGEVSGYETKAYALEAFSDAEWQSPERERRLEALERATLNPGGLSSPTPAPPPTE